MSISPMSEWRMPGCDDRCRPRIHDPYAHEAFGRMMAGPTLVVTGPLTVNLTDSTASVHGADVPLSNLEWRILVELARRAGQVVPAEHLIALVWGPEYVRPGLLLCKRSGRHERADLHTLRVRITGLRARLGPAARRVVAVRGRGYQLDIGP